MPAAAARFHKHTRVVLEAPLFPGNVGQVCFLLFHLMAAQMFSLFFCLHPIHAYIYA